MLERKILRNSIIDSSFFLITDSIVDSSFFLITDSIVDSSFHPSTKPNKPRTIKSNNLKQLDTFKCTKTHAKATRKTHIKTQTRARGKNHTKVRRQNAYHKRNSNSHATERRFIENPYKTNNKSPGNLTTF